MSQERLLAVGYATRDIIEGKFYKGGAAAGIAINGKRLGIDTALLTLFGTDKASTQYFKYLTKIGVDIALAQKDKNVLLPTNNIDHNDRTNGWDGHNIEAYLPNISINESEIERFGFIHLASAHPTLVQKTLSNRPKKGEVVSFSPGPKSVLDSRFFNEDALRATDILFLSETESVALMNFYNLRNYRAILSLGPKTVVVTFGEKGSRIISQDGDDKISEVEISAIPIKGKPSDPTGAGDAYALGFLIGRMNQLVASSCAELGAILASLAIERKGVVIGDQKLEKFRSGTLLIKH